MKTALSFALSGLLLAAALPACTSNTDAVEAARKVNAARNEVLPTAAAEVGADSDANFLIEASSNGLMEVALCSLVAQRATAPAVRAYAQRMLGEHSRANLEITTLAQRKKIILPTMMGEDAQDVYRNVEEKKGAALDRTFIREMRQGHEAGIQTYANAAGHATDPDIRALATRLLPHLQEHLALATTLEQELKQ